MDDRVAMNVYVIAPALIAFLGFLMLKPWLKVLVAFIVMSNCFDLAPQIVYGKLTWDYGAVLMLIAGVQLFFRKNAGNLAHPPAVYYALAAFLAWLLLSLVYSLVIYAYPVGDTLKTARYWIIGYLSTFVILKLYMVDREALHKLLRWLYAITYLLLAIAIAQLLLNTQWLFGLYRDYAGTSRYLPIFLPVALLLSWNISARFLAGKSVKWHEFGYGGLTLVMTALTYTRGLYAAVALTSLLMLALLALGHQIRVSKASAMGFVGFLLAVGLAAGGLADRVLSRAASGLDILLSDKAIRVQVDADTFTGRLKQVQERFGMVASDNPVIGYGYLHETDVPEGVRNKLRYGSIDYSPQMVQKYKYGYPYRLSLYSPDIGWGNIVLVSGFVGLAIFVVFIFVFVLSYREKRYRSSPDYYWRLAFYLETVALLLLMFNGNTFTYHIQFPAFMLAGYIYLNMLRHDQAAPAYSAEANNNLKNLTEGDPCLQESRL